MNARAIIWDWNGTLLNDLGLCVSSINILLENRKLPILNPEKYKEVFSFPVKDYYQAVGFDFTKEAFKVPAMEFISLYESQVENCTLQPGPLDVLSFFEEKGLKQFVLSAMHQDMLEKTLKHNGIFRFFEAVAGLGDHYAVSKVERGQQLINQFKIEKEKALIIGDTIHDFEVAQELGIRCILIADGHQSEERLKKTGAFVLNNLFEMKKVEDINFV
ncbi:HAD family hydrolase [Mariniphaga sp.]|uniref:HAD family hydrolase n=1 Tax=Mariniphaga sp. TaxID=1954475 RepID=UPI0035642676